MKIKKHQKKRTTDNKKQQRSGCKEEATRRGRKKQEEHKEKQCTKTGTSCRIEEAQAAAVKAASEDTNPPKTSDGAEPTVEMGEAKTGPLCKGGRVTRNHL